MRAITLWATCAALLCSTTALAVPTVTVYLESPQAGLSVTPGSTVNWSIKVAVSTGDNAGLAMLSVDLTQDAANPAKFDLPPGNASSIPAAMANFNRPAGVTNPGEGGASGYIGVQRGTAGQMHLVQIGGGQNTFGAAIPPGGGIGENATVVGGIGQGGSSQLVLSGSFTAPATSGSYTFRLQNALANVLNSVQVPPQFSPVTSVMPSVASAHFTFTVAPPYCHGDLNCDGQVSFKDINPFVLYLSNFTGWQGTFTCNPQNGDINGDGSYPSFKDINPFVSLLSSTALPIVCP